MKIVAFGASNSRNSINKKWAHFVANQFNATQIHVLDLNDYEMPIYSIDKEQEIGLPQEAHQFVEDIQNADLLIISLSEHNGTYTTAFKNIFDWASRVQLKFFENKKMLLMATAPGPRGGKGVLEAAESRFPIHGAEIVETFILPSFNANFDVQNEILNELMQAELHQMLDRVMQKMSLVNN